jgi:hypothetical protein
MMMIAGMNSFAALPMARTGRRMLSSMPLSFIASTVRKMSDRLAYTSRNA